MSNKWIVTHSVSYEVEAPSAEEALAKFERESNFPQTKQEKFCEDWWDEEKKDTLVEIISEALMKKTGKPKKYDEYKKFWVKYKKILRSVGWKTNNVLAKNLDADKTHPQNSNDDLVSVRLMCFDPNICYGKTKLVLQIFYVDIPKQDAFKILALGAPF